MSDPALNSALNGAIVTAQEVTAERARQLEKWGVQHHPDGTELRMARAADYWKRENDKAVARDKLTWLGILAEEVYEAFAETEPERLREELIQVAAVAVAWVEDIDSRA